LDLLNKVQTRFEQRLSVGSLGDEDKDEREQADQEEADIHAWRLERLETD